MPDLASTLKPAKHSTEQVEAKAPGLVQIWLAGRPVFRTIPLAAGPVEFGREHPTMRADPDPRMSRRHAQVTYDGHQFIVQDLGSSNGTAVDGKPLPAGPRQRVHRLIRMGDTLFIAVADIEHFAGLGIKEEEGFILGPTMQSVRAAAAQAAQFGDTLLINGESGAGKEGIARAFHAAGPAAKDRFVAVNCATIPEGIAERLLFGAKRGAYSGADADSEGYLQAAEGGTLFLDEIGDLDLSVQAKLLRVLENKEIMPLGATRPRPIKLRVCSATHKDLRTQVAAGRMREDLYFRLAHSQLMVPPLRDRPEEIPWLLTRAMERVEPTLQMEASFAETCLLRAWPGNVRELLAEVRSAAQAAITAKSDHIKCKHLRESAGSAFKAADEAPSPQPGNFPDRQTVQTTLGNTGGNVKETARLLNLHRTQLYRLLDRYGIDVVR